MSSPRFPADFADAQRFAETLFNIYGPDLTEQIVDSMGTDAWQTFWENPLVEAGVIPDGDPVAGAPGMWRAPRAEQPTRSAAAERAQIYFQNPSSYLAVAALAPGMNEEVLDLAAAPGGKTIRMAALMANTGRIAAVEPVKKRFHRLRANLERCAVTNVALYQRDGRGVGRAVPARFDRVLLDAPCSSEARMRWNDPGSYRHWSGRKVRETQRKQKSLLRSAYAALKPGGRLLYSTCSFSPEENELVVAHLLKRSDAQLLPLLDALPDTMPDGRLLPGLTAWSGRGLPEVLAHTARVVPDGLWNGFYLALLNKPCG